MRYRFCVLLSFVLLSLVNSLHAKDPINIIIRNQDQFDKVVKDINNGQEVTMQLLPGQYVIKNSISATKPLRIYGNQSIITQVDQIYSSDESVRSTSTHYVCKLKGSIEPFSLFFDQDANSVPISASVSSQGVNSTTNKIIGTNTYKSGVEIKIPLTEDLKHLSSKINKKAYGFFDCGWARCPFKVNKTDKNYLYCETTSTCSVGDFNYDISTYKKELRFMLYNLEINPNSVYYDSEYIYIPKSVKTLSCLNSQDKYSISTTSDIVLSGLAFNVFHGIKISSKANSICDIRSCSFSYTISTALDIIKENSLMCIPATIDNCKFAFCSLAAGNVIKLQSQFQNHNCIRLMNSEISRYTDGESLYKNCNGIVSVSADALIQGNTVYNTSRNHVHLYKGQIEVLNNIIYNSNEFNSQIVKNLSNDFGLVYCGYVYQDNDAAINNKTDLILIRDNYIHGAYAYGGDGRGIMIDDGRGDVICEKNLILDTQYYSIDSREVPKFVGASSVRNLISGNIVDNVYRLESGAVLDSKNKARSNNNLLLGVKDNRIKNSTVEKDDSFSELGEHFVPKELYVDIPKKQFKSVKKNSQLKVVKRFFKTH